MSKKNRLRQYKNLVASNRLDRDDGALEAEFGLKAVEKLKLKGKK